jgi:hypothetical protein
LWSEPASFPPSLHDYTAASFNVNTALYTTCDHNESGVRYGHRALLLPSNYGLNTSLDVETALNDPLQLKLASLYVYASLVDIRQNEIPRDNQALSLLAVEIVDTILRAHASDVCIIQHEPP